MILIDTSKLWVSDEEETSIHFIAQCSATMLLRRSILGDYTLSLDALNGIHWTVLLRFAKASSLTLAYLSNFALCT